MKKKFLMKKRFVFFILILVLFSLSYDYLDNKLEKFFIEEDYVFVERVIDGDTIKTNNGSIRLLGINSPEKGEEYSSEAGEFLEELILEKNVRLVYGKDKKDRYGRILAYIYLNNENINQKMIEEGLASPYFPSGKDVYYNSFLEEWNKCLEKNINLCEKSNDKCAECIILKNFDWKNQLVILENICYAECNLDKWKIKDEGRKNYIFENYTLEGKNSVEIKVEEGEDKERILFWRGESYVWTDKGDSLFLRDSQGKLVLWESY